jgi:hypothetical protein
VPSILLILLLGSAGAVLWRRDHVPADAAHGRDDIPVRLLQWAIGLLPADRADWGRAMIAELDRLEGRSQRWRFALGCVGSLLAQRPRRGAAAGAAALVLLGLGGAVVFGVAFARFGLDANPWNWVLLAVMFTLVLGYVVGTSALVRRPGVVAPGLTSGLVLLISWLASRDFTFSGILGPVGPRAGWPYLVSLILVPVLLGLAATLRSGSAVVGRRTVRLAGVVAGLGMFLASTIAIVATHGGPRGAGQSVAYVVSDGLANQTSLNLMLIPLATATVGWAAAAATFRVRFVDLAPGSDGSIRRSAGRGRAAEGTVSRSGARLSLRVAVVAGVVVAAGLLFLAG